MATMCCTTSAYKEAIDQSMNYTKPFASDNEVFTWKISLWWQCI